MESDADSALLRGSTRVLHYAVARLADVDRIEENLAAAIRKAMALFADELFDRIMLCAFIGGLDHGAECNSKVCKTVMKSVKQWGIHDAIFTTLEEVMQVLSPNNVAASVTLLSLWLALVRSCCIHVVAVFELIRCMTNISTAMHVMKYPVDASMLPYLRETAHANCWQSSNMHVPCIP